MNIKRWFAEKKMTRQEAEKEIADMFAAYRKRWPHVSGLLVGSSLVGNGESGDSARYWYLKEKFGL